MKATIAALQAGLAPVVAADLTSDDLDEAAVKVAGTAATLKRAVNASPTFTEVGPADSVFLAVGVEEYKNMGGGDCEVRSLMPLSSKCQ